MSKKNENVAAVKAPIEASGNVAAEAEKPRKPRGKHVPDAAFITAWETSAKAGTGVKGVAELTGLEESSVNQRATKLRGRLKAKNAPFTLSPMQRGGGIKTDFDAIEKLLGSLQGKTVEAEAPATETAAS